MDGDTLNRIRQSLLARRDQLGVGETFDRERDMKPMNENQAEIVDMAQALEQLEREQSLAEQERKELIAIERALAKMASGNFGTCEDCEEEIPQRRLTVLPEARLCAKCQEIEERQQSRVMRGGGAAVAR